MIWLTGKKTHFLFVLGNGLVRTFPTKSRKSSSSADQQRVPRLSRYKDFKVPGFPDDLLAPLVKTFLDPEEYLDLTEKDLDGGNNTLVLNHKPRPAVVSLVGTESPIPQAEIESSAPYQPFHTDRRVALYGYGPSGPAKPQIAASSEMPTLSKLLETTSTENEEPAAPTTRRKQKEAKAQNTAANAVEGSHRSWVYETARTVGFRKTYPGD